MLFRSADGRTTGINIEQIALHSPALGKVDVPALSNLASSWQGRSKVTSEIGPSDAGRWLVFGQSLIRSATMSSVPIMTVFKIKSSVMTAAASSFRPATHKACDSFAISS